MAKSTVGKKFLDQIAKIAEEKFQGEDLKGRLFVERDDRGRFPMLTLRVDENRNPVQKRVKS